MNMNELLFYIAETTKETLNLVNSTLPFNMTYNDAPEPWQLGFQDSASPSFAGLGALHDTIGFYLILISVSVFWVLFSAMYYYSDSSNKISYKYLTHGNRLSWCLFVFYVVLFLNPIKRPNKFHFILRI